MKDEKLNKKTLQEVLAVKLIARVLGEDYRGVHTGSDTSKPDGEIRLSGSLYALVEVTVDADEKCEEDESIWLNDLDKAHLPLRPGSGAWRIGLQKVARWNQITKENFQALVDTMKSEGIQSIHTYDGIPIGISLDICIHLRITNIDLMDIESDGVYRSFSTEPNHFDDSGDPFPAYLEKLLQTKKIKKKIKNLIYRANGSPTFLAVIVGSATELSARFGMLMSEKKVSVRTRKIDLPKQLSAVYILHPGAGCAIWFHSETGWGEKQIETRTVIALLQEAHNQDHSR